MLSASAWEAIFLLLVLKIPMVYLAIVVWWAIRAEPVPGAGDEPVRVVVPLTPCGWNDSRRRREGRPLATRRPLGPRGRPTPRPRVQVSA
jgi:hypothetical protein